MCTKVIGVRSVNNWTKTDVPISHLVVVVDNMPEWHTCGHPGCKSLATEPDHIHCPVHKPGLREWAAE